MFSRSARLTAVSLVLVLWLSAAATAQEYPPPRGYAQAVFCENTGEMLLFGGQKSPGLGLADTWIYSPQSNSFRRIVGEPSPGNGEGPAVYHAKAGRVILFQTYNGVEDAPLAITWSFDPVNYAWTRMDPAKSPPKGIFGARMVYDRRNDRIILFGGFNFNQTWQYDYAANSWSIVPLRPVPPSRNFHSMIYDEQSGRIIVWGGESDTRVWSLTYGDRRWNVVDGVTTPPPVLYTSMQYIPSLKSALLFGGYNERTKTVNGDTWLLDLARMTFRRLVVSPAPSPRAWQAMTVSRTGGEVYLFGGGDSREIVRGDLWVFDPATLNWKELKPPAP